MMNTDEHDEHDEYDKSDGRSDGLSAELLELIREGSEIRARFLVHNHDDLVTATAHSAGGVRAVELARGEHPGNRGLAGVERRERCDRVYGPRRIGPGQL